MYMSYLEGRTYKPLQKFRSIKKSASTNLSVLSGLDDLDTDYYVAYNATQ